MIGLAGLWMIVLAVRPPGDLPSSSVEVLDAGDRGSDGVLALFPGHTVHPLDKPDGSPWTLARRLSPAHASRVISYLRLCGVAAREGTDAVVVGARRLAKFAQLIASLVLLGVWAEPQSWGVRGPAMAGVAVALWLAIVVGLHLLVALIVGREASSPTVSGGALAEARRAYGAAGDGTAASRFDVELVDAGARRIQAIKVLRELTGVGLVEAKALVDLERQPPVVLHAVTEAEAANAVARLETVGATAVSVPI